MSSRPNSRFLCLLLFLNKHEFPNRDRRQGPQLPGHFTTFKTIRKRFKAIEQLPDLQQRGFELEGLIFEIARLTFDILRDAVRILCAAFDRVNSIVEVVGMKGFRAFLMRGNAIDLAVAVVIGAAFGGVVSAFPPGRGT